MDAADQPIKSPDSGTTCPQSVKNSLAIALSGGGLRATFFELGILVYLAISDELKNVNAVVSVSGGSILAAHFAMHWQRATENRERFIEVASELVRFTQSDIRNSAFIRWLWQQGFITFPCRKLRPIEYLRQQYERHFGKATLEELPTGTHVPKFAFVATDAVEEHRVAIMTDAVYRFDLDGHLAGEKVASGGAYLSLVVAASSCFPPVFTSLRITNSELGLMWNEFKGKLTLRDGGIYDNLGVEVLACLMNQGIVAASQFLVCDAEQGMKKAPADRASAILGSIQKALSTASLRMIEQLGDHVKILRFASRSPEEPELPTRVMTAIADFRTDLDKLTWSECHALMLHGAAIAHYRLAPSSASRPSSEEIKTAIRAVLMKAGCPADVSEPREVDLKRCGWRSYWCIGCHMVVLLSLWLAFLEFAPGAILPRWPIHPYRSTYHYFNPPEPVKRDVGSLLDELAKATCEGNIEEFGDGLRGSYSQVSIKVADGSSNSALYVRRTIRPVDCDRDIYCELVFRGSFPSDLYRGGAEVTVTGTIDNALPSGTRNAYIYFGNCEATPTKSEANDRSN